MNKLCFFFFMFYCYSIMGWITECIACSIKNRKFVHDRGFLVGPYCPIYGYGAMYIYIFLNKYCYDPIALFIMAVVGTSILEYFTSYFMEKLFKARWWDYSDVRYNLEGRICLTNSILFGILALLFIYKINPLFLSIVDNIPSNTLNVISIILFITFLIDNIFSFCIMGKLKSHFNNIRKDSTSDIDQEVKEILSNHKFYLKKLFNSFPKVSLSFPTGEKVLTSIRKTLDSFDLYRKGRKKKVRLIKKEWDSEKKS